MARTTFGVFNNSSVRVSRDGYNAEPVAAEESRHASFDDAYDAALVAGGDRWVISTNGTSEYVPVG